MTFLPTLYPFTNHITPFKPITFLLIIHFTLTME